LADTAVRLLQHMQWYGPAEVEFRIDPRDGKPTLMEVNPRLWGSLFTGIVAGVDFPYMLYRMAMDGDVEPVTEYRTDRRARYFFTLDLLCMATHPHKREIAREWVGDFFNPATSMLLPSRRDPGPLFGKLLASLVYGTRPSRLKERLRGLGQRDSLPR
jgi:predicted ATP-grasp superfamily ATP-dependent carboligase